MHKSHGMCIDNIYKTLKYPEQTAIVIYFYSEGDE